MRFLFLRGTLCSPSAKPIIDTYTRRMVYAMRNGVYGGPMFGVHICSCGCNGKPFVINLPGGHGTHPHGGHLLAFHRESVPQSELDAILETLPEPPPGEPDPTEEELNAQFELPQID